MSCTLRGTCSLFGGPSDKGVAADEDLALYEMSNLKAAPAGLFLTYTPHGTTGTARRLNPQAMYCALRFAAHESMCGKTLHGLGTCLPVCTPPAWLRSNTIALTNPKHPDQPPVMVHVVDWGPNSDTKRLIDLSPGAAAALGVETDDEVIVTMPIPTGNE